MYWHVRINYQSKEFKCKYCDNILKQKTCFEDTLWNKHGQEDSSDDEYSEYCDLEESKDEGQKTI